MSTLLTTDQAAVEAWRSPATIRAWVRRGYLKPVAWTINGRPLYDVQDVWNVERDARRRDFSRNTAEAIQRAGRRVPA